MWYVGFLLICVGVNDVDDDVFKLMVMVFCVCDFDCCNFFLMIGGGKVYGCGYFFMFFWYMCFVYVFIIKLINCK